MDRQTNERIDRGTDKCTNGRTDRHHTDGPSDLRTDRQTSFGRTDRHHSYGPTDIWTDRQTYGLINKYPGPITRRVLSSIFSPI